MKGNLAIGNQALGNLERLQGVELNKCRQTNVILRKSQVQSRRFERGWFSVWNVQ